MRREERGERRGAEARGADRRGVAKREVVERFAFRIFDERAVAAARTHRCAWHAWAVVHTLMHAAYASRRNLNEPSPSEPQWAHQCTSILDRTPSRTRSPSPTQCTRSPSPHSAPAHLETAGGIGWACGETSRAAVHSLLSCGSAFAVRALSEHVEWHEHTHRTAHHLRGRATRSSVQAD